LSALKAGSSEKFHDKLIHSRRAIYFASKTTTAAASMFLNSTPKGSQKTSSIEAKGKLKCAFHQ